MDSDSNNTETPEAQPEVLTPDMATETTPQIVPDFAAPAQTAFATTPHKRRSVKLLISGAIAAALIVIGGGSALAYTQWYQNSDKVVHDAVLNAIQAKAISTTGTITYKSDGVTMDIALDGASSEANGEFTVKAKMAFDTTEMKQSFDAGGTGRMVGDTLYVKVSGVKSVVEDFMIQSEGQIPSYAADIFDKIEDKWISIKASDYQDIDESIARQQTCFMDLTKKMQSDKSMSDEVMKLYRANQILVVKEKLGSKNINGVASLGYKVDVNRDATESFARGLGNTTLGKEVKNCSDEVDFNTIAKDIAGDTTNSENFPTVELWASQFGHSLTEISVRNNDNTSSAFSMILQPTFNKTVNVEAPSEATPLKTVLGDIQQAVMDSYMQTNLSDDLTFKSSSPNFELSV